MLTRPVDMDGDMMPVADESQMFTGARAVARIVQERIQLYQGEWWEDETIGIQLPKFLADTLKASDVSLLAKYVSSYIAQTPGVVGVTNVGVTFENRVLTYSAVVRSDDGSAVVEVNLSGIL